MPRPPMEGPWCHGSPCQCTNHCKIRCRTNTGSPPYIVACTDQMCRLHAPKCQRRVSARCGQCCELWPGAPLRTRPLPCHHSKGHSKGGGSDQKVDVPPGLMRSSTNELLTLGALIKALVVARGLVVTDSLQASKASTWKLFSLHLVPR